MEDAMPTPNYTWYKGEDPVVPDGRSVYVSNVTHTLLMREVGDEQEGSYHCRVENSAGSMDSPLATLTVKPQQEFAGIYMKIRCSEQTKWWTAVLGWLALISAVYA